MPTEMSVHYDLVNRVIKVPVCVDSQLHVWTPPVAIPNGEWHLCWEIDEESQAWAGFDSQGVVKIDTSVPRAKLELLVAEGCSCQAKVTNGVEIANGFSVDLWLVQPNNGKPFKHDPTIAVTPDPLDPIGPPSHGRG